MRNFTVITIILLCSLSTGWISVSASQTVEVQSGEEVTLLCSNFSSSPSQIIWFKMVNRTQPQCVAMVKSLQPTSFCDGFQNGKFEMRSNMSTLFLKIKQVDLSDSGLYFCGYQIMKNPVIVDATYLEVQEVFDGMAKLTSVVLGCLTVFLIMVVFSLTVKIVKLQKAHVEVQNLQRTQTVGSDHLEYAAVTFHPKTKRNHRPASERQVEPNAIYSATR